MGRAIKKKYEDDGEARGGQRLLGSITKVKAIDCAVVVSRVFGGRMLGKVSVSFPPFSRISHTSFFPDLTGCIPPLFLKTGEWWLEHPAPRASADDRHPDQSSAGGP